MSRATLPYEIKIMNFNFSSSLEWQLKLEFMRLRGKEGIWSFHNGKKKKKKKGKLFQYWYEKQEHILVLFFSQNSLFRGKSLRFINKGTCISGKSVLRQIILLLQNRCGIFFMLPKEKKKKIK